MREGRTHCRPLPVVRGGRAAIRPSRFAGVNDVGMRQAWIFDCSWPRCLAELEVTAVQRAGVARFQARSKGWVSPDSRYPAEWFCPEHKMLGYRIADAEHEGWCPRAGSSWGGPCACSASGELPPVMTDDARWYVPRHRGGITTITPRDDYL